MKCARDFLFLAGFLISACSYQPDPETAKLQRFYAEKGEGMTPMINKVKLRSPQHGTIPSLSTTNAPIQGTVPSLSTTNAPVQGTTPSLSPTNAPIQGTTPSLSPTNEPIRN